MLATILLLFIWWNVAQLPFVAHAEIGDNWTEASQSFLQQVYTNHDYCVLTNPDPFSNCKRKASHVVDNSCSSLINLEHIRSRSHLIPQSMYHLPIEFALNESPLTQLTTLFISLNRTNRVLMLIGDSITRNSLEALQCLLSIESRSGMVSISPPVSKILWGGTKYTISLANPLTDFQNVTVSILYLALWTPYANGAGSFYLKEANRLLKHDPSSGIVFVFNIGMHEKHEPTQRKHIVDALKFASSKLITMENRTNLFLYRESSAQHFNSTAGYYNAKQGAAWKSKKAPLPTCVPYSYVQNDLNDWRYNGEQGAFKWTNFDPKNIIPFRKISRHYYDVHSSSPFFKAKGQKAGPDRDCTHFMPLAAPVMYRLLWYHILQRALQ